ncbi:MAG: hypothetical protein JW936_00420 [Sedimentisphaerales bacterium]|nr:hypothetical protein [Sedimentisphaerales bacterium]
MRSLALRRGLVFFGLVVLVVGLAGAVEAGMITEVSIPVNSMDSGCHPAWDNVWTVSSPPYPLDVATGIGWLVNDAPAVSQSYTLHDHVYAASYVPDPARAVVTYRFDQATVVDQIQMIQHINGIWKIEGYVGNSVGSLASIGTATVPQVTSELQASTFDFDNTVAGTYFRFVITGTDISNGYACYRAYPADSMGQRFAPIPEPLSLSLLAFGALTLLRRRA